MTKPKNFIAFEGTKFTIEWYYTEDGKMPAKEYFNSLTTDEKVKAINLFKLMGTEGRSSIGKNLIMNMIRYTLLNLSHTDFCASFLLERESSCLMDL